MERKSKRRSGRDSDRERRPGKFGERRSGRDSGKDSDRPKRRFDRRGSDRPRERRSGRRDDGPKRFDRRSSGRDSEHEMHSVICDKCGKECEVPFKPTSSKPIFCNECFRDNRGSGGRDSGRSGGRGRSSSNDLDKINRKLDKIMKALKISE